MSRKNPKFPVYFSADGIADLLDVPVATVERLIDAGKHPKPVQRNSARSPQWHENSMPGWLRALDRMTGS